VNEVFIFKSKYILINLRYSTIFRYLFKNNFSLEYRQNTIKVNIFHNILSNCRLDPKYSGNLLETVITIAKYLFYLKYLETHITGMLI